MGETLAWLTMFTLLGRVIGGTDQPHPTWRLIYVKDFDKPQGEAQDAVSGDEDAKEDFAVITLIPVKAIRLSNALRLSFFPKDGMSVRIEGRAGLYGRDGSFQVYAERMEKTGDGALYQKFLALRDELKNSYVLVWEALELLNNKFMLGVKIAFDRTVTLIGSEATLKAAQDETLRSFRTLSVASSEPTPRLRGGTEPSSSEKYTVTGAGMTLVQVCLSVSDPSATMSLSHGGTEYTQAAIAAGTYGNMHRDKKTFRKISSVARGLW